MSTSRNKVKEWKDIRPHERRWVAIQAIKDEIRYAREGIKIWGRDSRDGKAHALAIIACRAAIAELNKGRR